VLGEGSRFWVAIPIRLPEPDGNEAT